MAKTVTSSYETEEAKATGAIPKFYVAFNRTSRELVSADYGAGVHTDTEFSGGVLQLTGGAGSGNWVSAVLDSAHLTANAIFDKITWTGSAVVQIRTASTSGNVAAASYATYLNGVLDHTERFRYYQIKISLTTGVTAETVIIRHKALIPKDEYLSLGSISYGVDIDFASITAGGMTITVDNSLNQWCKRDTDSYIYQTDIYFQKIEVWAGFELSGGSDEWTLQFLGEIESIAMSDNIQATISARDFLFRKLANTKIGRPDTDGTPSPYMAGKRYRVPCIETTPATHVFSFYCQQTITSIDETYIRDSNSNTWEVASPSGTSVANKTVTFASDPQADVAVDITIDTNVHPCDIITDIIENELSLDTDQYDATSISDSKTNSDTSLEVGVSFDNISVMDAFKMLAQAIDAAVFIEGGELKVVSYFPDVDESFTFTDSNHRGLFINDSIEEIQNTSSIFYGDYDDDKSNYIELQVSDSVTDYGELSRGDLNYKYSDPISVTSSTHLSGIMGRWLARQDDQYEIIKFTVPLKVLRVEIMDIVAITSTKHSLTALKCQVYQKDLNLDDYSGTLTVLYYANAQWLYWLDADPTEDLRYLLDYPVIAADEEYKAYYW